MQWNKYIPLTNGSFIVILMRIMKQLLFSNCYKEKHNVTNIKAITKNATVAALQSKKLQQVNFLINYNLRSRRVRLA